MQSQGPLTAEGPRTVHADYDGSHGDPNADSPTVSPGYVLFRPREEPEKLEGKRHT